MLCSYSFIWEETSRKEKCCDSVIMKTMSTHHDSYRDRLRQWLKKLDMVTLPFLLWISQINVLKVMQGMIRLMFAVQTVLAAWKPVLSNASVWLIPIYIMHVCFPLWSIMGHNPLSMILMQKSYRHISIPFSVVLPCHLGALYWKHHFKSLVTLKVSLQTDNNDPVMSPQEKRIPFSLRSN